MSQQQAANPITETGAGLFPFRRVLVLLNETELDRCVLGYLGMLEEAGSAAFRFEEGTSNLPISSLARKVHSHHHEPEKVQAAFSMSGHRGSVSVSFRTVKKNNRRDLRSFLAQPDVDLILVGRPSHTTDSRHAFSVIRHLALGAACPVWIVPDTATTSRVRSIVVPMDFGEPSGEAAQVASMLASAWQIPECLALHAYFLNSCFPSKQGVEALNEGKWHAFSECTSRLSRNAPWFKLHFEEGPRVSEAIVRFAERNSADLIVMGAHQRSQCAATLLGSTLLETLERSRIPVLVVKSGQRSNFLCEVLDAVLHPKDALQTS
jgi:nucleotide-binding universal stress UspA family protein